MADSARSRATQRPGRDRPAERYQYFEIVRTAVETWLEVRQQDECMRKQLESLDTIQAHWQALLDRRDGQPLNFDPAYLIERMREERGDELLSSVFNSPENPGH